MIAKLAAARTAVEYIESGMVVGLGSGSTSELAIRVIGEKVRNGLSIRAVASSDYSANLARQLGIPMIPFADALAIDITVDGADEVDPDFNLIKGGGGALLREKIVAYNSKKLVIMVDESKLVSRLGLFPLPVEIVSFANELTLRNIEELGCKTVIRSSNGEAYVSDNGNYIADCSFNVINDPSGLHQRLKAIPGVVETGLFIHMTDTIVIGSGEGTTRLMKR
jgi:ribose 5-phosphate isomerase A